MTLLRSLRAVARAGPRLWMDIAVAAAELARARMVLPRQDPRRLVPAGRGQQFRGQGDAIGEPEAAALVTRIAYAVPRVAARVPWRSDCLVQALAAPHWLSRHAIPSRIRLGVDREGEGTLVAHAWLESGGRIVTGGDIGRFVPLSQRP